MNESDPTYKSETMKDAKCRVCLFPADRMVKCFASRGGIIKHDVTLYLCSECYVAWRTTLQGAVETRKKVRGDRAFGVNR